LGLSFDYKNINCYSYDLYLFFYNIRKIKIEMKIPKLIKLNKFFNKYDFLMAINSNSKKIFPFKIKRIFFVNGKKNSIRGNHAHNYCSQLIICLEGRLKIQIQNKYKKKYSFVIDSKRDSALFLPKQHWVILKYLEKKNIISVICDYKYDKRNDYINNLQNFYK